MQAIVRGELHCELAGVVSGNGYISALDFAINMPKMCYQMVRPSSKQRSSFHSV